MLKHFPGWFFGYQTSRGVFSRRPTSPDLLLLCARHLIGATCGDHPVRPPAGPKSALTVVTAPGSRDPVAGHPSPSRQRRNRYAPSGPLPLAWFDQPWYQADREVLP